jgi:hypothetical protein
MKPALWHRFEHGPTVDLTLLLRLKSVLMNRVRQNTGVDNGPLRKQDVDEIPPAHVFPAIKQSPSHLTGYVTRPLALALTAPTIARAMVCVPPKERGPIEAMLFDRSMEDAFGNPHIPALGETKLVRLYSDRKAPAKRRVDTRAPAALKRLGDLPCLQCSPHQPRSLPRPRNRALIS